ncbi:MAG: hypothetical protein KAV43_01270 [Hadesarchaea archaeon]|nr:hypothetical protein [Hadesarchaea archaeon]
MRAEGLKCGLGSITLVFALVFSITFLATPVLAEAVISEPGGTTIEVEQGQEFVLPFRLEWDETVAGFFAITLKWVCEDNDPAENFTIVGVSAYFDNLQSISAAVKSETESPLGNGTLYIRVIGTPVGDPNNGPFNVDITIRAGSEGVPHAPGTDNIIIDGSILVAEDLPWLDYYPPDPVITVRVLGRGVAVSISPSENSGPSGATLEYTVTVKNTGSLDDNFTLTAIDNAGWGPTISPNTFSIPAGENRAATLSVMIPENALGSTRDNVTVGAIGTGVEDSASCIAHAAIVRGVKLSTSPTYQENLPGETLSYVVTVFNTGNIEDSYTLENMDNEGWTLTLDNALLTIPPWENRMTTLSVIIPENAIPCTEDNITVTATSTENAEVSAENSCIAHVKVLRGVEVSISPENQSAPPEETLTYEVTVTNTGNVEDTYDLAASDNAVPSWNPTVSPTSLTIAAGGSDTTTLSVTIPESALACTEDNITVTATSTENAEVSAENSCIAHALAVRGIKVSILPTYQENLPGGELTYNVIVTNTGNIADNYALTVSDNAGWGPTISPTSLAIAPAASDNAILSVIIPENAAIGTRDNITVTATSTENAEVSAENSCIAHVAKRGVEVSISPSYQENQPGGTLTHNVIVKNTGLLDDNYILSATDNLGWGPIVSPTSLVVPAGENRLTTLDVTIPLTAAPSTVDNIRVTATSQEDNTINASDTCLAHTVGPKTETTTVIYPTADVYAFGEFETGYSRSQLKFNIGSIPSGSNILSAKLWLYRLAADSWDGGIVLNRVDNQVWEETITASEFDAQTLTNEENQASKFMSHGWDYLNVENQLNVDYGVGYTYASFRLRWANDNGSKPSVGIDDGRFLVINSEFDELFIIFSSSEYDGIDPYLEITYVPPYAVSASISPTHRSGSAGEVLSYTVTVLNTGNLDDNYVFAVSDNAGWEPTILPISLAVDSGSVGEATLSVTIPENAAPTTTDNIIVRVISTSNPTVSASSSCVAHRVKAEFSLATLYKITLDLDVYLANGSRLVVKFYTYAGAYQAESMIWSGLTPAHVVMFKNVPHPENKATERATLVLTDDNENVIWTIASFVVRRDDLFGRTMKIKGEWPYASPDERNDLFQEIMDIKGQWPYAPS